MADEPAQEKIAWQARSRREQVEKDSMPPIYMLYDGSSVDGTGKPDYVGRTISKAKAREFVDRHKGNPYWIGCVKVLTDKFIHFISQYSNDWEWDIFPESEGQK